MYEQLKEIDSAKAMRLLKFYDISIFEDEKAE
jgi:hypothetical protein